jgi:hypothetical protein
MSSHPRTSGFPHLPFAPVAVRQVRTGHHEPVSTALSLIPALLADLALLAAAAGAGFGVARLAEAWDGTAGRSLVLIVTVIVVATTAYFLRRAALHGRPPLWATLVCIGWGLVAALWVPRVLIGLLPGVGWSEGVFTADTVGGLVVSAVVVQALLMAIVVLPALVAPGSLRGWARGFTTGAAVGLGYGGMQAVLVLTGGHLVGLTADAGPIGSMHVMAMPVLQAFVCGWGGILVGVALTRGTRGLLWGWPLGVVGSGLASTLLGGTLRARALCRSTQEPSWCVDQEPATTVFVVIAVTATLLTMAVAVTAACLGWRRARLRALALEGLVAHGWYTEAEALVLTTRPARRQLLAWSARRGGRAQARSVLTTADHLIEVRLEIEDLADPLPSPAAPRAGLVAEQEALLQRTLTARESLRRSVAQGPGGWTAS